MTKLQVGITGALAVAGAAGYLAQGSTNDALRQELAALQTPSQTVAALRVENQRLSATAAEAEELRRDDAELRQLERRVAEVKRANEEKVRVAQARALVERRRSVAEELREKDRQAQQEVDRLNAEGNVLVKEYKAIAARTSDANLTVEQRTEVEAAKKAKMAEIQAKQKEVKEFIVNVRNALGAQAAQQGVTRAEYEANDPAPSPATGRLKLSPTPGEGGFGNVQFTPVPPAPRP